ncbi:MAG: hypothetical protein ACLR5Q_07850 [Coprococcus sp.]
MIAQRRLTFRQIYPKKYVVVHPDVQPRQYISVLSHVNRPSGQSDALYRCPTPLKAMVSGQPAASMKPMLP